MQVAVLGNRSYLIEKVRARLPIDHVRYLQHPSQLSENDDIAFCLGYYRLIKPKYFQRPKHGTFVAHATDLPKGRGWAPVNWALINNEDKVHITTFQVEKGCDTGPYHMKSSCDIDITDTYESVYSKIEVEIVKHLKSIIKEVLDKGEITLTDQVGEPTWNPRRAPEDSELDVNKSLMESWLLIRACKNDEYPAFFKLNGKKVYLRYEVVDE